MRPYTNINCAFSTTNTCTDVTEAAQHHVTCEETKLMLCTSDVATGVLVTMTSPADYSACNKEHAAAWWGDVRLTSTLGRGRWTMRSNLPGLVRAESRAAGLLVAAMTTTPVLSSKPSISVSSWLMVCTDSAHAKRKSRAKLTTQLFVIDLDHPQGMTLTTHRVDKDSPLHAIDSMQESSDTAWQCQTQCAGSPQLCESRIECASQDRQLLRAGRAMCCNCNSINSSLFALQTQPPLCRTGAQGSDHLRRL